MTAVRNLVVFVSLALVAVLTGVGAEASSVASLSRGVVNEDVKRAVDISEQVEHVTVDVVVANQGAEAVSEYVVAIPGAKAEQLAWISAKKRTGKHKRLSVREVTLESLGEENVENTANARFFRVKLKPELAAGDKASIVIDVIYTHVLHPLPKKIKQGQAQNVEWLDSAHWFTPYVTESQVTNVKLGTNEVISYTKTVKPVNVDGSRVRFGTYSDRARPFSVRAIRVHYQNNTPFATFTSMVRDVEVSHWGNVAIEEHYELQNTGAQLTGEFSRFDYDRNRGNPASFSEIRARLPKTSFDVYYRDGIGNISSSHVRVERKSQLLEVQPRFPMMGGWKTEFTIGYNVLSHELLSRNVDDPSTFVLDIDFSTPFDDVVVDDAEVHIILPEGAHSIEYRTPFEIDSEDMGVRKTYLDTVGRPMLILKKKNLVRQHKKKFQVTYKFSSVAIYREPMLLVAGFFLLNVVFILFARLDLSIAPAKPSAAAIAKKNN
eukprot:TRINITY_DN12590_c0_g1_i1.p1 TRINITY_DN12590_c0_g1~~TRINITY_DN12590_c0_g1_i1.p1  ORF type:complete len:491 (-),score=276.17 TRINITY_DN12590_c0_g1_i1:1418-2890(-)